MIYAEYNADEAKNLVDITLGNGVSKLTPEDEANGWKSCNATFHLENAVSKYFSLSKEKTTFALIIGIKQDNPYLWLMASGLRNFARGIYNQMNIEVKLMTK